MAGRRDRFGPRGGFRAIHRMDVRVPVRGLMERVWHPLNRPMRYGFSFLTPARLLIGRLCRPCLVLAAFAIAAILPAVAEGNAAAQMPAEKTRLGSQANPGGGSEGGMVARGKSGLPLPRFASLRASKVNVRTGPGVRYPVEWVFVRRSLPIEIVAEFGTWRKIRDWQGTEGWVHRSMLSGRRTVIITGAVRTLRRKPSPKAPAVARIEPGVVARLLECERQWCAIEAGGFRGWLRRDAFWGTGAN